MVSISQNANGEYGPKYQEPQAVNMPGVEVIPYSDQMRIKTIYGGLPIYNTSSDKIGNAKIGEIYLVGTGTKRMSARFSDTTHSINFDNVPNEYDYADKYIEPIAVSDFADVNFAVAIDSNGKAAKTDSDNNTYQTWGFVGFNKATATADGSATVQVQINGVVTGFAGLTPGADYYLSGTLGGISTTQGTNIYRVGIALTATTLLIMPRAYKEITLVPYTVGDVLLDSADNVDNIDAEAYTKVKEILIGNGGTLRIKYDQKVTVGTTTGYTRVYQNGAAVGSELTTSDTNWVARSQDIAGWAAGDLVQLYIHSSGAALESSIRNFRIYTSANYKTTVNLN